MIINQKIYKKWLLRKKYIKNDYLAKIYKKWLLTKIYKKWLFSKNI